VGARGCGVRVGARGCGVRAPAGVYLEVPLSRHGRPLRDFLIDPVIRVPDDLDLVPRGVTLMERVTNDGPTGVYDVWDHVGERHYPNVADFVEEVSKMGLSRRVQGNLDFSKLSPASRIILMHPYAHVENAVELYRSIDAEDRDYNPKAALNDWNCKWWNCPCCDRNPAHQKYPRDARECLDAMPTCIGSAWQLVTGGEMVVNPNVSPRWVTRRIGSTTYRANKKPSGFKPQYARGIFMILPATKLVVINDPDGGYHRKAMERATRAAIPVEIQDE
jgi:hypothetical protein